MKSMCQSFRDARWVKLESLLKVDGQPPNNRFTNQQNEAATIYAMENVCELKNCNDCQCVFMCSICCAEDGDNGNTITITEVEGIFDGFWLCPDCLKEYMEKRKTN